jgi:hypothetical protein
VKSFKKTKYRPWLSVPAVVRLLGLRVKDAGAPRYSDP